MVMSICRDAIRTDRALTAAHGGTALLTSRAWTVATKPANGLPQASFVGVPTYVADQESHPPRGTAPV